jgi:hypothetical protein
MGEHNLEGVRFFAPKEDETLPDTDAADVVTAVKPRRPAPKPAKAAKRK